MVNGSGSCGFMPGTHFQSSDSAFHRCTWASTMVRFDCAVASFDASAAVAATVDPTNWRRDSMDVLPRCRHSDDGVAKSLPRFRDDHNGRAMRGRGRGEWATVSWRGETCILPAAMSTVRRCGTEDVAAILEIVNAAAAAYRGVIPADQWHEPYMPADELEHEIAAGVAFWGLERDGALAGVMGLQPVRDVDL